MKAFSPLFRRLGGLLLGALLLPFAAGAHTQSSALLTVSASAVGVTGEWHLALRDLEDAVGLDADDDGRITWEELRARRAAVTAYAQSRLHWRADGNPVAWRVTDYLVADHPDGAYAVLRFAVDGTAGAGRLAIDYTALFDLDPKHRGILHWEQDGRSQIAVLSPGDGVREFTLGRPASPASVGVFLEEGIHHIWTGYDHLLFLLALLLPGVLAWQAGEGWRALPSSRAAGLGVVKVVTAFTLAHSLTLGLAAMGWVRLPVRWTEAAIAASVIVAAANNFRPFFTESGWRVAFGFGLLHGFGFASGLHDLGLRPGQLAGALLGFNVGVEIGQLAIVALFLPLALLVRHRALYQQLGLHAGSGVIIAVATVWFAERVGDFKWLPF